MHLIFFIKLLLFNDSNTANSYIKLPFIDEINTAYSFVKIP